MKNLLNITIVIAAALLIPSCILEDVEPEYDVVGGVATVSAWTPSKLNPAADEQMSVLARYYSEHAPVVELRFFVKVGAADPVLTETVPISNHNTENSYERTFNYTIPNGTPASTVIIFTIEVETPKDLITIRSTPSSGASAVRTI